MPGRKKSIRLYRCTEVFPTPSPGGLVRILLLALILWPALSSAGDLLDLYQAAKTRDHPYLAARAEYEADSVATKISRADLLPSVSLSADSGKIDQEINRDSGSLFTQGRSRFNDRGYSISARQPLVDVAKWRQLKKARGEVSAAQARWRAQQQSLIARLVTAWLDVLEARGELELAQADEKAVSKQLELARSRLDAGLAAITEVHETRARSGLARSRRIQAEIELGNARSRLHAITGSSDAPAAPAFDNPDIGSLDDWLDRAEKHSAELDVARAELAAAEAEWKTGKADHYPVLELVGEQSYRDAGGSVFGDGRESTRKSVKLELSVPLFHGGKTLYQNRQLDHRRQAAREQLAAARQELASAITESYNALAHSAEQLQALQLAVKAARQSMQAKSESFDAGLASNLDILNAEGELMQARQQLNQARYQRTRDWIRLRQQAGVLNEQDLRRLAGLVH
ncbi:MAG: hypothetical protein DSZ32_01405 [Gammaproteobacteria bacterium]|nr:MAG: hypothetical protein DSZ32_01405 [Gammaproteobacteria bacterium]